MNKLSGRPDYDVNLRSFSPTQNRHDSLVTTDIMPQITAFHNHADNLDKVLTVQLLVCHFHTENVFLDKETFSSTKTTLKLLVAMGSKVVSKIFAEQPLY